MSFWFGDFELDQEQRRLLRSGEPVPLEPKAYELLSLLLERRPRALSRAQIRDAIWPRTFVAESTLAVVVNGIRHALSDDVRAPRFIRTVHGFGYAFCGEVRESGNRRLGASEGEDEGAASPYPGLLAFTEREAASFFGREAEVEALWEKVRRRRLLALIGPSGVGKTSFLRAGVIPSRPSGWSVAYATPGASPMSALVRALVPDLAGDADAMGELLQAVEELTERGESDRAIAAVRLWRKASGEALVVVDQCEELFALNAPETQSRFSAFLGRLPEETGAHVLLTLRDDFLFTCGQHDGLRPVFQDLTPLGPPSPEALRRALLEPAARRGVRFEDESLVDEMVDTVASERGALPLLAFAIARLWEERDRSRKLLTREAYELMGGVGGALAHHAEATLAQLGDEREAIVREVFRNLVTAQGTRAAVERTELLSVFGERRDEAAAVLDALVDARLLTEYEAPSDAHAHRPAGPRGQVESDADRALEAGRGTSPRDETADAIRRDVGHRSIEIVHESLLTHWPRLARWRTQDADGAQLRDQLRQAARLWDERGRADDLLWTGTSYLDYRAWRARYAGALSALEEAFAQAMAVLADRRRHRRRMAVAAVVAALTLGLGVLAALWARSEAARQRADGEALRAEASKLLALGQAELERNPTAALAYATKSLELADTEEARRFALRVLQGGPTTLVAPHGAPEGPFLDVAFSPDGEWLVDGGLQEARLHHRDGGPSILVPGEYPTADYAFGPESSVLVGSRSGSVSMWSVPDGREVRRRRVEGGASSLFVRGNGFFTSTTAGGREIVRWAPLVKGDARLVGAMDATPVKDVDAAGTRLAYVPGGWSSGRRLYVRSLENWATPPRLVATHPAGIVDIAFHPDGRHIAAGDTSGTIRIWASDGRSESPLRTLACAGIVELIYSPGGRWLAAGGMVDSWFARLWDLTAPPATEPLRFPIFGLVLGGWAFDPSERWLAAAGIDLWPVGQPYPRSVGRHDWFVDDVIFTPDGSTLVSVSGGPDSTVRAWSLSPDGPAGGRILLRTLSFHPKLAVDPKGAQVAVSSGTGGRVFVMPLSGGEARELKGFSEAVRVSGVAFAPDGLRLAAVPWEGPASEKVIRVWDVKSGASRVLGPLPGAGDGEAGGASGLSFLNDGRVVVSSPASGIRSFDLQDGRQVVLSSRPARAVAVGRGRLLLAVLGEPDELVRIGLDGQTSTRLFPCPGCRSVALDPTGTIVGAGSEEGIVRIGSASGGEPHLFLGRSSAAGQRVAFSADGRWVASSGEGNSVRLWPVPDLARTPLHKRTHDEVLATLHSWTNLRAVRDPQSPSGWKLEPGPFPGWEKLPER